MSRGQQRQNAAGIGERRFGRHNAIGKTGAKVSAPAFRVGVGIIKLATPDAVVVLVLLPVCRRVERSVCVGATATRRAGALAPLESERLHQIETCRAAKAGA